jgi:hypothetical protein
MDIDAGSTDCYYYGCLTAKCVAPGTASSVYTGVTAANEVALKYPAGGYAELRRMRSTSFLTCKISDHTSAATNVIVVPFKN